MQLHYGKGPGMINRFQDFHRYRIKWKIKEEHSVSCVVETGQLNYVHPPISLRLTPQDCFQTDRIQQYPRYNDLAFTLSDVTACAV
jgi:hypothetical protein